MLCGAIGVLVNDLLMADNAKLAAQVALKQRSVFGKAQNHTIVNPRSIQLGSHYGPIGYHRIIYVYIYN